jgi:hypothetical protein
VTTRKAVLITPEYTLLSGTDIARTPADTYAAGPVALAERVAPLFRGEGVLLVDAEGARRLKLAETWQTVETTHGPRVYLGVIDQQDTPLIRSEWHQDTVASFEMFHELLGVPFHRSGGVAGLTLLQHLHPKGRTKPIVWQTDGPPDAYEMQYYPEDWRRDDPARFRHGYDRRRSGLAAMGVVHVARYALRHTRKRTFDPKLAGWWLVEIPPWNIPWMPNPAGYCTKHPGAAPDHPCIRWVTSPTIELLNELALQGKSEGVRFVHDSWVGERSRLFYGWAAAIETAYNKAEAKMDGRDSAGFPLGEALDAERVRDALKDVYRETPGMFANPDAGWIRRSDWFAAKVAVERSNAWRAVWNAIGGQREPRYPTRVDGDKWWFASDAEDGAAAVPPGLKIGNALGEWRLDGTVGLA